METGGRINPSAVQAMAEVGIDITGEFVKPGPTKSSRPPTAVITMVCEHAGQNLPRQTL
ncbi:hypothetical protein [Mycolicibacterium chlorophenolicum]|uniref:hypothetical protein n=1 Tax=Mycolicibacterium TaxID=1866885 RepID=UPI0002F5F2CC|nr:hypothetical protein [Mycolicibacterium chlorophenolicum]